MKKTGRLRIRFHPPPALPFLAMDPLGSAVAAMAVQDVKEYTAMAHAEANNHFNLMDRLVRSLRCLWCLSPGRVCEIFGLKVQELGPGSDTLW